MKLALEILVVEAILFTFIPLLMRSKFLSIKKQTNQYLSLLGLFLIVAGAFLVIFNSEKMEKVLALKKWPVTTGVIVSSKVVGKRAFRPDIKYKYTINNKSYSDTTFLHVPGFGGRSNRLDAAEKIVQGFPPGTSVTVHYNPTNPQQSVLKANPWYSIYLQLAFGATLFACGVFLLGKVAFEKGQK